MTSLLERRTVLDTKLSSQWATGKCKRNHDITKPENVRLTNEMIRGQWRIKRTCMVCYKAKRNGQDLPAIRQIQKPEKICIGCGRLFRRMEKSSNQSWAQRKYCSSRCRYNHYRLTHPDIDAPIRHPLPPDELARLRRLVNYDPVRDSG